MSWPECQAVRLRNGRRSCEQHPRPRQVNTIPQTTYVGTHILLGLACRLLLIALALQCSAALAQAGSIAAVRSWLPPPGQDRLDAARDALALAPDETGVFTFRVAPGQPAWYALDIVAGEAAEPGMPGESLVLELTHPSLRSAQLHLPAQQGTPARVISSGREVPAGQRAGSRFPATLELPAAAAAAGGGRRFTCGCFPQCRRTASSSSSQRARGLR